MCVCCEQWPSNIYNADTLIHITQKVTDQLRSRSGHGADETLSNALAKLYELDGQYERALGEYLRIHRAPEAFNLIRQRSLFSAVSSKILLLLKLDLPAALELLVDHVEEIRVRRSLLHVNWGAGVGGVRGAARHCCVAVCVAEALTRSCGAIGARVGGRCGATAGRRAQVVVRLLGCAVPHVAQRDAAAERAWPLAGTLHARSPACTHARTHASGGFGSGDWCSCRRGGRWCCRTALLTQCRASDRPWFPPARWSCTPSLTVCTIRRACARS